MYIIARDGSGDFTSIQAAIDAVPVTRRSPAILLVRMDEYHERVVIHKDNIRLVGEARDRTVISASACAADAAEDGEKMDPFLTAAVLVTGRNVTLENLTIRNDAPARDTDGEALALYAAGDRCAVKNCRILGRRGALFAGPLSSRLARILGPRSAQCPAADHPSDCPPSFARAYFDHCVIGGEKDMIFGPGPAWFENCELNMGERGGYCTAPNTPLGQERGLVFSRCRLTGVCPAQKKWTDEEAASVTLPSVIGGWDDWRPDAPAPTWYLCGDSTMADYPPEQSPMTGWGQVLEPLLPERARVENDARCGRSSKRFVAEGRLSFIELCLRPGDRLVISFSHNDEKSDPGVHTDPRTTFPEYLSMYIDAARRQGAVPILVTPVPRRRFDEQGRLIPTHGAYPAAMRELAWSRGVPLIDLEKAATQKLEAMGPEAAKSLFCHVAPGHPNYPDGLTDDTHLQTLGALAMARLFVSLLPAIQ